MSLQPEKRLLPQVCGMEGARGAAEGAGAASRALGNARCPTVRSAEETPVRAKAEFWAPRPNREGRGSHLPTTLTALKTAGLVLSTKPVGVWKAGTITGTWRRPSSQQEPHLHLGSVPPVCQGSFNQPGVCGRPFPRHSHGGSSD